MNNDQLIAFLKGRQREINAPDILMKPTTIPPLGKIITLSDIKNIQHTPHGGVFTDGKNGIIVYIYDQFSSGRNGIMVSPDGKSDYRFHLCECQTIHGYIIKQQYDTKYISHIVRWGDKTEASVDGETRPVQMKPCKNCLSELNWNGYRHANAVEKQKIWDSFNLEKDYRDFFNNLPGTKYSSICVPKNDYPINWSAISSNFKKRVSYRCEFCGSNEDIETHHINGDRALCSDTNLIALCHECHDKVHNRPTLLSNRELQKIKERQNGKIPPLF